MVTPTVQTGAAWCRTLVTCVVRPVRPPLHTAWSCRTAIGRRYDERASACGDSRFRGEAVQSTGRDGRRRVRRKDHGRPWDFGKNFDESAPCSALAQAATIGHPSKGAIWLKVNGKERQKADLSDMIWSVPEQIAFLSEYYTLEPTVPQL